MQKLRPALSTPWRGLAPAQVQEGEQVPSMGSRHKSSAVSQAWPQPFSSLVLGVEELNGM